MEMNMKSFRSFISEDDSIKNVVKGRNRQWFKIPTAPLGKNNDLSKNLYDLINKTYKPIGGYPDFKSSGDLPSDHTDWIGIDVDKDPEIDAIRFSKPSAGGQKMTGSATDGGAAAKKIMLNKTAKLLRTSGNYAEMSDAMAHIMITRHNAPVVTDEKQVNRLLAGKKIEWHGAHPGGKYPGADGWYTRMLGGSKHMKIMLGTPK